MAEKSRAYFFCKPWGGGDAYEVKRPERSDLLFEGS